MRSILTVLVALSFSVSAFAAEPAKAAAPAKAEPAKAEPAKAAAPAADAKPAAVAQADCDACKANMAFMKAGKKVEAYKLDNGQAMVVTAPGKDFAALEKAAGEMEAQMKLAMEGKAKLDENCVKMVEAMKAGKVMMGHGEMKDGFVSATLSSDPEIVKNMHAMMDKMAAPAPKAAAPAKK